LASVGSWSVVALDGAGTAQAMQTGFVHATQVTGAGAPQRTQGGSGMEVGLVMQVSG
jgi:hypothetical protein